MIVLPTAVRDAILTDAEAGAPEEICGVLGGSFDSGRSRVRSRYRADNVAERPRTRYRIDPEEEFDTFERLEDRDEDIAGFYHSHPWGPPGPSATDAARATWPDRSYVIVSLAGSESTVSSWRWREEGVDDRASGNGRFERERVVVE